MKNNELTEVNDKSSAIIEPIISKFTELSIEHLIAQRDALVAENAALRVAVDGVNSELYGKGFEVLGWHLNGDTEPLDTWFEDNDWDPETPVTDAAIAEIKAQGVDELAEAWEAIKPEEGVSMSESTALKYKQRAQDARDVAANLRAGRKG
ncbi:hypothetical protein J1779_15045 [Rahnella sp. FC061912-K]|uniref:hypothetical protein n=1 Tax=Rahnella rivi TaxID=2816249 RepID=UPI001C276B76|nr:hypothetical protein [Rahnella rivi]MBU9831252.1 hypothetical protein [Rahnella rivi]